jgi:hypothetical protein
MIKQTNLYSIRFKIQYERNPRSGDQPLLTRAGVFVPCNVDCPCVDVVSWTTARRDRTFSHHSC